MDADRAEGKPQFAVVREDPRVELALLRASPAAHVLLVASGGDTALALRGALPRLRLTLVEPNPAQRDHVRAKEAAWRAHADPRAFNVGCDDPSGLAERGNFEALFRTLRAFLHAFVAGPDAIASLFAGPSDARRAGDVLFASPYWSVAFSMFFSDPMLHAMFGPAATQHARPGSYPAYFQAAFERGFARDDAAINPFLHHLLLGRFATRAEAWPEFLRHAPRALDAGWVEGTFDDVAHFAPFDLVDLSNVLDWSDRESIARLARRLGAELRPGARVFWRQLNNEDDLESAFGPAFAFDPALGNRLLELDRSLFYCSAHVGTRIAPAGS